MIPFLEKLDQQQLTKRVENKRVWKINNSTSVNDRDKIEKAEGSFLRLFISIRNLERYHL